MSVMSTTCKPAAITTTGLTKSYGDKPVLEGARSSLRRIPPE